MDGSHIFDRRAIWQEVSVNRDRYNVHTHYSVSLDTQMAASNLQGRKSLLQARPLLILGMNSVRGCDALVTRKPPTKRVARHPGISF